MKRDPSKIKCGECGKNPSVFNEHWDAHTIQFCMNSTGVIEEDGELNPGEPTSVYAACDCGHEWKLKGITQIDQLRNN